MSVAIIAALPREIAGLVRGVAPEPTLRKRGVLLYRVGKGIVVAAGMGSSRAALAVAAALEQEDVDTLISVGLAGGCARSLPAGAIVSASTVIDERTGERFQASATEGASVLVSSDGIASVREKARLATTYGAAMVDMEAATVARLASAHGLAFQAIKGISDTHDFELESLARFATAQGQFRTAAFALHTALRPAGWPKAMELGKNSKAALRALTERLWPVLQEI